MLCASIGLEQAVVRVNQVGLGCQVRVGAALAFPGRETWSEALEQDGLASFLLFTATRLGMNAAGARCWHRRAVARRNLSSSAITSPQPIRALLAAHHRHSQAAPTIDDSPLVQIVGFARSIRYHRKLTFISLTDGSLPADSTLQAVIKGDAKEQWDGSLSLGVALELTGRLQKSKGKDQPIEFAVQALRVTGPSEASSYPLASTSASLSVNNNLLRKYAHLRPRDARHAAVLRARNVMERALSDYFWENDFTRVAAPIITSSDCEGGGEVFQVDSSHNLEQDIAQEPSLSGSTSDGKSSGASGEEIAQEPSLSGSTPDQPSAQTDEAPLSGSEGSLKTKGSSFWSDTTAYLTVSAQLHLEALALGLGKVYTVGPSFRAESSATNRHLVEFWMCEGEMVTSSDANLGLEQVMGTVEGLLKQILIAITSSQEAAYLWNGDEKGLSELQEYSNSEWPRMTYTEAIESIQQEGAVLSSVEWGDSLASEQERWLARRGPIFITHYPAPIKPFYMRQKEEGGGRVTSACFDLLVPRIGELVGGSLREERRGQLAARLGASSPHLQWYIDDLRKYGCNPHGGFGLGMERLVSFLTRTENIRDCLTFPRVKGPVRF